MYRNLHQLLAIALSLGKFNTKASALSRTPVGLSVSLTQSLQKSLYRGLYRYGLCIQPSSGNQVVSHVQVSDHLTTGSSQLIPFRGSVRNVHLLPGESVNSTFSPENGRISDLLCRGRMLVLTNQRIIAFCQKASVKETALIPLEEIKIVTVNAGQRSKATLLQGSIMIVAAVMLYVLLAYWLTGRIDGPQIPVIRMDLVAFVVFLAVLTGVAMLAQGYFAKPDGEVTFQGDGVMFTFPFRGETSEEEMYDLVNKAFAARQQIVG